MFWIVKCEMFWIERRKCFYYMCSVSCFGSNVKCFGLYVKFEMFLSFLKNYDYISNSTFNFISAAANLEFEGKLCCKSCLFGQDQSSPVFRCQTSSSLPSSSSSSSAFSSGSSSSSTTSSSLIWTKVQCQNNIRTIVIFCISIIIITIQCQTTP